MGGGGVNGRGTGGGGWVVSCLDNSFPTSPMKFCDSLS